MNKLLSLLLSTSCYVSSVAAAGVVPGGLSAGDWSAIQAVRHEFQRQAGGGHAAVNPGLGWQMTFDERGFTATNGEWTWGLELERTDRSYMTYSTYTTSSNNHLYHQRGAITEWFINDQRGLQQGWVLTAPAEIHLRVRGSLKASVSAQSISFGDAISYSGLKAWDATGRSIPTHFEATAEGFAVRYDDSGAQYPLTIDPIAQNAYLKASNAATDDVFGVAVAISGNTAVVAARGEDSNAVGVNGDQFDNSLSAAGAVYVFVKQASGWVQQAYLKASNTDGSDQFGVSLAISGDTIVVGAPGENSAATGVNGDQQDNSANNAGAAYVFVRQGTTWSQQAYLKASNTAANDDFGHRVAISGNTIVVTAPVEESNATGVNGNQADNSADEAGAAYVFVRSGTRWSQQAYLKASNTEAGDTFGEAISISGDTIVVGTTEEASAATGVDGDEADNSAEDAGAAYVFFRKGTKWSQQAYLKASNTAADDDFGSAVSVSGDTIVVAAMGEDSNAMGINGDQSNNDAPSAGSVYIYRRTGSVWAQEAYVKASNAQSGDRFGTAVSLSGDSLLVSAEAEDSNATGVNGNQTDESITNAGAAYLFVRHSNTWSQLAYLKASNPGVHDNFGESVGIDGALAIVGSVGEDSNAAGINGNQANDLAENSGAAYAYSVGPELFTVTKTGLPPFGIAEAVHALPTAVALGTGGKAAVQGTLIGSGTTKGRNRVLVSTPFVPTPPDTLLQSGDDLSGLNAAAYVFGTKVTGILTPLVNFPSSFTLFQATVSGPSIKTTSNRAVLIDNGAQISLLTRTGLPLASLGGAKAKTIRDLVQAQSDFLGVSYQLQPDSSLSVNATNDSGMLSLNHSGTVLTAVAREGETEFNNEGDFAQFHPRPTSNNSSLFFIAKFIPTVGGGPLDGWYEMSPTASSAFRQVTQGQTAFGALNSAKVRTMISASGGGASCLRTTLAATPTAQNEIIFNLLAPLNLQKGVACPAWATSASPASSASGR